MAGIFEKARILVLGNLHYLLDKGIDLNSLVAVKQYIRDLEEAKEKIADEAAIAGGQADSLKVEIGRLKVAIGTTNENIDLILSDGDPSNDGMAVKLEKRLMETEEKLPQIESELLTQQQAAESLREANEKLQAKYETMVAQLRKLQSMQREAEAKERTAQVLLAGQRATALGEGASIDSATRRLEERSSVANARFDRAMGGVQNMDDDIAIVQAKKRLEERKARMAASATSSS